jgi:hypothetical protein
MFVVVPWFNACRVSAACAPVAKLKINVCWVVPVAEVVGVTAPKEIPVVLLLLAAVAPQPVPLVSIQKVTESPATKLYAPVAEVVPLVPEGDAK